MARSGCFHFAGRAAALGRHVILAGALVSGPGLALAQAPACDQNQLAIKQIGCFLDAAESVGDPALCESADDATVRFHCLSLYAERSGDSAVCARIRGEAERTQALRGACIAGVAVARKAPEVCAEAPLPPLRDACYLMLVTQKNLDRTICERIDNADVRRACAEAPAAR